MDRRQQGQQFRFSRNDTIGNADAESDTYFLSECFIDGGELNILRDLQDPKRIIVGRTGSGKSALVHMLMQREDHVYEIRPDELSLNYLANSAVLRFFEEAGTHLDVFYQLLWKHVLAVELIRRKYRIQNDQTQKSFFERLSGVFNRDKAKEQAVEYLTRWGNEFWNETESRVREVTTKIEEDLRATLAGSMLDSKLEMSGSERLTAEEKAEVVRRGARAVNQVQLSALSGVIKLLGEEVFSNEQDKYYIVIDDLDTQWTDDRLKLKLIRALIETVRAFRQVSRVKIICTLRLDLLQRVISATRDSGFQSEKYEPLYLRLRWTEAQLSDLVNTRVSHLVRKRYTSKPLPVHELFPKQVGRLSFIDFLCQRTALRPRDAILFVNECLARAGDRGQITVTMVTDAEAAYSEKRLQSLQEEWGGVYPSIGACVGILARKNLSFPVSELSKGALEEWMYSTLLRDPEVADPVVQAAKRHLIDDRGTFFEFVLELVDALYVVGALGVKPDATSSVFWSHYSDHRPAPGSIRPSSTLHVHPTYWRCLGIKAVT